MAAIEKLSLEQRTDVIESKLAIQELVYGYALAWDRRDVNHLLSIFHEDADYLMPGLFGEYHGWTEIRRAYDEINVAVPDTWHFTTNLIVKVDGDRATGISEANVHATEANGRAIRLAVAYLDNYERRAGRWAISRRMVETHYITGLLQAWGLSKESKFPKN
ncbi:MULTISPECIES: nuclear transport factor 2 family protein [unclassified Methylibium]|uniref:nuclear transport factor 2 family protein n=1 Tax=unclassified Methylibium TaxID=2633235 RepID=UPI0003F3E260|nr:MULTISPECIES: nuclear transport factor 2 family protein [unclassified Methylibium]EWS53970.1 Gamma-hexachlorocyclohexane dehydrochlorinase [Methylibium sp. T29]EWS58289.1 Gamma-hexachlorocyclohexane dehydrochlorinase [Methylibium sp. T29-B]